MSAEARKQRRRVRFRGGLSVRQYARTIRQDEMDEPNFGMTLNLQTAARHDGTGMWRRVQRTL